jgi:molecular chaperone GrpE
MNIKKQSDKNVEEIKQLCEEWKLKYLRALADYQNLEKFTKKEIESVRIYANEALISDILPIVDGLETANSHLNDEGLELVIRQFQDILKKRGVEKFLVIGQDFDPTTMECIEVGEGAENKVIADLRNGYHMYNKIIRPARVKVGKQSRNTSDVKTETEKIKPSN